ncbi:MAG: DUF6350 family protein [Bowdeniella nasicola]|nr:DUF6350 family protein [Bowdeniella nasicola]
MTILTSGSFSLPHGWVRALRSGVEAVLLTWLLTVSAVLATYAATADAPQLGQASWKQAMAIAGIAFGSGFGNPVITYLGTITLIPLTLPMLVALLAGAASWRSGALGWVQSAYTGLGAGLTMLVILLATGYGVAAFKPAGIALCLGIAGHIIALGRIGRSLESHLWAGPLSSVRAALGTLPVWVRQGFGAAYRCLPWIALMSLLTLVVAIASGWQRLTALTGALVQGAADTAALWGAHTAYLPNAMVWALGWIVGAGFHIGDAYFHPGHASSGVLPAIPLTGAAPTTPWSLWVLLVPIVLAAIVGAWHGWREPAASLGHAIGQNLVAGVVLTGLLGTAAWISAGGIAGSLLAHNGVNAVNMLIWAGPVLAVPYCLGGILVHPDMRVLLGSGSARAGASMRALRQRAQGTSSGLASWEDTAEVDTHTQNSVAYEENGRDSRDPLH